MKKLFLLFGLLLVCPSFSHAQTFKQFASCTAPTTPACNAWSVGNLTAGDSLIAIMNCSTGTCSGQTVPTSAGMTFTQIFSVTGLRGNGDSVFVYRTDGIAGGNQPTITFHTGSHDSDCFVLEYTVVPAFDQSASNSSVSTQTSLTTGTTGTTVTANELVIVDFLAQASQPGTPTVGYASRVASAINNFFDQVADKTVSSTGTQSGTSAASATAYSAIIITFGAATPGHGGGFGGKSGLGGKAGFGFWRKRSTIAVPFRTN